MAFKIIRNDITKVCADAIVNTANPKPVYGSGTDTAIYEAAGAEDLLKEREKIGEIKEGQAAATKAFALDAKYIIHTVGPVWIDGEHGERDAVRSCYENSLKTAKELGCESIAFPLIATGSYGFPKAEALQIAISVFSEFLAENEMQITLVVFDEKSFVLSGKIFSDVDAYIDENYVSEQLDAEYGVSAAPHGVSESTAANAGRRERRDRRLFGNLRRFSKNEAAEAELSKEPADLLEEEETDKGYMKDSVPMMGAAMSMAASSLDERVSHVADTWQESLLHIIDEKGYTDIEVYKRANVDRKLFSKIRSNRTYQPKKITAVAFALALRLNLDETRDLLGRAGYALSPSSKFDLIIEYFIENEVYDTYTINLALFDHDQPTLGE